MHRQRANGGVVEPLDVFLLGHTLRGFRSTRLSGQSEETLLERFGRMPSGRFHIVNNNCEQWAFRFIGEQPIFTDTDLRVLAGIGIVTFIIYRISK